MPEKVVTRFAPSPTGYLHVGGGRTALFNWLWARCQGGTFILRIEDTDLKRNTPTAAKQVMQDLRWLGIEWDEGPEVGGPNGPYLQSQRLDIYNRYVRQLLDAGQGVLLLRDVGGAGRHAGAGRGPEEGLRLSPAGSSFPPEQDVEKARAEGKPVTVRFALPMDKPLVVDDVIRGRISFDPAELGGDFIILKSDGFPTYNFACVVDDYQMEITHVIRGQEHLMNTPGQKALWEALFPGSPTPQYAHMSVTVSDTGGKLSKRERPQTLRTAIDEDAERRYREAGRGGRDHRRGAAVVPARPRRRRTSRRSRRWPSIWGCVCPRSTSSISSAAAICPRRWSTSWRCSAGTRATSGRS